MSCHATLSCNSDSDADDGSPVRAMRLGRFMPFAIDLPRELKRILVPSTILDLVFVLARTVVELAQDMHALGAIGASDLGDSSDVNRTDRIRVKDHIRCCCLILRDQPEAVLSKDAIDIRFVDRCSARSEDVTETVVAIYRRAYRMKRVPKLVPLCVDDGAALQWSVPMFRYRYACRFVWPIRFARSAYRRAMCPGMSFAA